MQTWLVHNRHPVKLLRQIGLVRWLSYQFFIGGSVATFLINPLLWLCFLAWLFFRSGWLEATFTGWVLTLSLLNFLVGNLLGIYLTSVHSQAMLSQSAAAEPTSATSAPAHA
jgi:hypothetical protein